MHDKHEPTQRRTLPMPAAVRFLCMPLAGVLIVSLFAVAPRIGGLIPTPWDKLAHLLFYGTIGVLIATAMRRMSPWLPFVLTCLAGATDELYQSILPGRSAGFDDFAVDLLASALATWLVFRFVPLNDRTKE